MTEERLPELDRKDLICACCGSYYQHRGPDPWKDSLNAYCEVCAECGCDVAAASCKREVLVPYRAVKHVQGMFGPDREVALNGITLVELVKAWLDSKYTSERNGDDARDLIAFLDKIQYVYVGPAKHPAYTEESSH